MPKAREISSHLIPKLGMKAVGSREDVFNNVKVPKENLLGEKYNDWNTERVVPKMTEKSNSQQNEEIISTTCASHCGGSCILKVHVKDGVIARIDTDDGEEPQLRACLRGRAYRQRVYAPDRILYPLKRVGKRGEGKFERISWDEALDTIVAQITRIRDTYGPASLLHMSMAGDVHNFHTPSQISQVLALSGGYTMVWGMPSYQGGVYAQRLTYGNANTSNTRDDLVNSRLIIMWGWNPVSTITGVNTNWYLAQAKEAGARIVVVDPKYTDSAATFADQWIPIRPGTDGAMLLAMAYVMITENLHNQRFLDTYTIGFDKFKDYVLGTEDGVPKTAAWAEAETGVAKAVIENLARQYATIKPAALMGGIAPGRTAYGEQYHRIAMAVVAMTGNVGIHGGDGGGRSWESISDGLPYKIWYGGLIGTIKNPVDEAGPRPPVGAPLGYRTTRIHYNDVADFILKGKAGGYPADCRLVAIVNCSYVNSNPNVNKIVKALMSDQIEFNFITEQFMTPTVKFADIVLPVNTFMERNDLVNGMGIQFYGYVKKAIESQGESKSTFEIACLLADRLGLSEFKNMTEEGGLRELVKGSEIPDFDELKEKGIYRFNPPEPYVAHEKFIEDPVQNPLRTPSGRIEIYSQRLADLNWVNLPPVPTYIESWEGVNDPLAARFPLQMINTHSKRRANSQFETIPWLKELEQQAVHINATDAADREIRDGDMVRVFNDRGEMIIPARVTERIMPGVVDVPTGAYFEPDENGVDRGGCANVLLKDAVSPAYSFPYNSCLVQIERAG